MKEKLLLSSVKRTIARYTIIDPGGVQIQCGCKSIVREFEDQTRTVVLLTVVNVNNIIFN